MGIPKITQNLNWRLNSSCYIQTLTGTSAKSWFKSYCNLFDELTPRAMEYIKLRQVCSDSGSYFSFGCDYNLALAWMYTRCRGATVANLVQRIETTHGSCVTCGLAQHNVNDNI